MTAYFTIKACLDTTNKPHEYSRDNVAPMTNVGINILIIIRSVLE
jgi:hypothetical protein